MSLKAYEDACARAELFGQPKPDREEFLEKHKHLDVVEFEEVDIKTAENTAMLHEDLNQGSAGLNELNTILTSTQTKINRLRGVCGSVTNFFRVKLMAKDSLSYSSEQSYVGQTNFDGDYASAAPEPTRGLGPRDTEMTQKQSAGDINTALADLEAMEKSESASLLSKSAFVDVRNQMTAQISKLDGMLSQADRAETSLSSQNKQMRSYLR